MRIPARRWVLLLAVLLPLTYAGCVRLPVDGPVVRGDSRGAVDPRQPSDIDPQPPQKGATRLDVVNGFLEAMTAWPISTTIAKKYLTTDAAQGWSPESSTVVYDNVTGPRDDAGGVSVRLMGASRLDSAGAWRGAVPAAQRTLSLQVVVEDGEYRIANPPAALLVPVTWFQQRFGQVDLYYFESQARFLVPEPVFVPVGRQLPTALVSALLAGPQRGLDGVVRSFLPSGLSVGLSVPVSNSGVADIALAGGQTRPSPQVAELMLSQIAATLRQDPAITGFSVTLNGAPLRSRDGLERLPVSFGSRYTAEGATAATELYGLDRGRLVSGDQDGLSPVDGPLGQDHIGPESVTVSPDGEHAAVVTAHGTTAAVAPVTSGTEDDIRTLLSGATSLARPTIDLAGRIWLLDRRQRGARVYCYDHGRLAVVDVPGVTGADARRLLVSRDGTRLISVLHRPGGDRVLASRVATVAGGRGVRVLPPSPVPTGSSGHPVLDIAWAAPTRLGILMPTRPGSLFQIDIVPEDGSTIGADTLSTVVSGNVLGLAGSPDRAQQTYAVLKGSLVDIRTRSDTPLAGLPTSLAYAG